MNKVPLEKRIDLAWYKKTGQMPAGWEHWRRLVDGKLEGGLSQEFAYSLATEFGISWRTVYRWSEEYKKEALA